MTVAAGLLNLQLLTWGGLVRCQFDPRNARAKKAYEKAHFRPYFQESEEDGVKYVSYLLKLSDYPEPARPPAGGQV